MSLMLPAGTSNLSSEQLEQLVPGDTLVPGDRAQNGVQCSDSEIFVSGHDDALMRRLFCLQYNMAPFLVEDLIAPALAQHLDEIVSAEVSRELHSKLRPHHAQGGGESMSAAVSDRNRRRPQLLSHWRVALPSYQLV